MKPIFMDLLNNNKLTQQELSTHVTTIYNQLGPGRREHIYQQALFFDLRDAGYSVYAEVTDNILYNGHIVGFKRYDLVIKQDDTITDIIEIKAVGNVTPLLKSQASAYKRDRPHADVYLINFGIKGIQLDIIQETTV